jgi:transglutaminase-like putative cysteine protease
VRYSIIHKTSYRYNNLVSVSHHLMRLAPRALPYQRLARHQLTIDPTRAVLESHEDYFGNTVNFVTIEGPHRQLLVESRCEVEVLPKAISSPDLTPAWEQVRALSRGDTYHGEGESSEFSFASRLIALRAEFAQYAAPAFTRGKPILEAGIELMRRINEDFEFDSQATTIATPLEQVFRQRRGVCQDFAQFQIACFRATGVPARYVSGYLETAPPPGQVKLVGADASHAWVQLWCGNVGWVDLDPTNNVIPGERHITLALGRDFADVSPLRGVLVGSGSHQLTVAVDVIPLGTGELDLVLEPRYQLQQQGP